VILAQLAHFASHTVNSLAFFQEEQAVGFSPLDLWQHMGWAVRVIAIVLFIAKHLFPSRFYAQAESGQKARILQTAQGTPHSFLPWPKPGDTPTNAPSHCNPPRTGVKENQAGSRPKDSTQPQRKPRGREPGDARHPAAS